MLWLTCEFDILTAQYYIFMNVKQYFTKKQWFYNKILFFINSHNFCFSPRRSLIRVYTVFRERVLVYTVFRERVLDPLL